MKNLLPIFISCIMLLFVSSIASVVYADDGTSSLGIATYVPITGKNITTGKIVSFANNGYRLSTTPYDALVIGVVTETPAVAIVTKDKNSYPVVSSGDAYVLIAGSGGNIKKGDLITSSSTPGVGMKAAHSGYVIGTAQSEYTFHHASDVTELLVSINIHYFSNRITIQKSLLDVLNLSATATYEDPVNVFKYFMAVLIVVLSFFFGFWFFGKTANRGIEAIGRNPLASKIIQLGILLNVAITIAIIAAGLIVAFFVIRL